MIADFSLPYRRPRHRWESQRRLATAAAAALLVALALLVYLGGVAMGSTAASAGQTYTVRVGDTLWSIAAAHSDGADVRDEIAAISDANHLGDPTLHVGQTLVIPSS